MLYFVFRERMGVGGDICGELKFICLVFRVYARGILGRRIVRVEFRSRNFLV